MKTMVSDNKSKDIPRLVKDLLEYDELKDSMVGAAIQSGVNKNDINLSQEKIDELYYWLREAEADGETGPPYNILDHYIITFELRPGWKIDAYYFEPTSGYRRLMCRIFRPNGSAYGCLSVPEITWDRLVELDRQHDGVNIESVG